MPHVITQACCADASCVYACPVNCIHPSPDEPGFSTAEMLHIDPAACVDCGACVSACPVDAIRPVGRLSAEQVPFIAVNAAHYPPQAARKLAPATKLAPVLPPPQVRRGAAALTVAIVGSGPAGMYAADELLTARGVRVNMFDTLPTPYGLVRAGVAPDHQNTKSITRLFDRISRQSGFNFYLNVEVGKYISHQELLDHHHAVIYAVGAPADRSLDIDGIGMPGTGSATDMVAWINGHPQFAAAAVELSGDRAVIIGNGNVALDVARILVTDPDRLACTDISDLALDALRKSDIREVVIAARRDPMNSAFTLPELVGLTATADVVLDAADRALVQRDLEMVSDPVTAAKLEILAGLPDSQVPVNRARIRLAYRLTPHRILGPDRIRGVEFIRTATTETTVIDAGLLLTSTGYRGAPVPGLPFDDDAAVVPNTAGRVVDPGTGRPVLGAYVAGWIKRGPTGFIGTNKSCAMQTVAALVDDYNADRLTAPQADRTDLDTLVRARQPEFVDSAGWRAIDAAEITRGAATGRPRVKFTSAVDMVAAATARDDRSREGRRSNAIRRLLRIGSSVLMGDFVPPGNRLR